LSTAAMTTQPVDATHMLLSCCSCCCCHRGPESAADVPAETGAEVEVFSATAATPTADSSSGGYMNGGARHADARLSDQDMFTGDYEVAAAGGKALLW
jgi:hypothetical protein